MEFLEMIGQLIERCTQIIHPTMNQHLILGNIGLLLYMWRSEVRGSQWRIQEGVQGKRAPLTVKILSFSSSSLQNVCQIVALSTPSRVCNPWAILDPPLICAKKMLNVLGNKVFRSNHITKNPKYRNFALSSTLHYYFRNLPDFQTM